MLASGSVINCTLTGICISIYVHSRWRETRVIRTEQYVYCFANNEVSMEWRKKYHCARMKHKKEEKTIFIFFFFATPCTRLIEVKWFNVSHHIYIGLDLIKNVNIYTLIKNAIMRISLNLRHKTAAIVLQGTGGSITNLQTSDELKGK